jgi:hypothetical protein
MVSWHTGNGEICKYELTEHCFLRAVLSLVSMVASRERKKQDLGAVKFLPETFNE